MRWAELKAVNLTGRAEVVDLDEDMSGRFHEELARKYEDDWSSTAMPQKTAEHYTRAVNDVVRFTPDTGGILNWDNTKLAG